MNLIEVVKIWREKTWNSKPIELIDEKEKY